MTSDQITIALGGDLFLVQEDIAIAVRLIDAQFPPYEQVIPEEHKKIITVDPLHFVDALRRAQLMSSAWAEEPRRPRAGRRCRRVLDRVQAPDGDGTPFQLPGAPRNHDVGLQSDSSTPNSNDACSLACSIVE